MAQESPSGDDFVLRRVPRCYFTAGEPIEILPPAFRPNEKDTGGISVFFAEEVTPQELVSDGGRSPDDYCVVRLRIADIRRVGEVAGHSLSVVRDEDPDAPHGHALIPEINWNSYQNRTSKKILKDLTHELAKLANGDIVYRPQKNL